MKTEPSSSENLSFAFGPSRRLASESSGLDPLAVDEHPPGVVPAHHVEIDHGDEARERARRPGDVVFGVPGAPFLSGEENEHQAAAGAQFSLRERLGHEKNSCVPDALSSAPQ